MAELMQDVLMADADVTAIAGERIARLIMPQDLERPFVVWSVVTAIEDNTLSCVAENDSVRYQVDVYSRSQPQAKKLMQAVRGALDELTSNISWWELFEVDSKLFRWIIQATFIQDR